MREPVHLVENWRRYDWRDSIFAPGQVILQALLPDGSTASGAGCNRESALHRCLGETAEWAALGRAGALSDLRFAPWRDGVAAHPDSKTAQDAALLEAYERFAAIGWWQGRIPARPVESGWLDEQRISDRIAAARRGAAQKRLTGMWMILTDGGPCVMVGRSTSLGGQQPVLGYGCDRSPRRAAQKALRELLLMEVNLMELLAAGSSGDAARLSGTRNRIESFARRCPSLLPGAQGIVPGPDSPPPAAPEGWFGARVDLCDITPPDDPLAVWLCRPAFPHHVLPDPDDSPFL